MAVERPFKILSIDGGGIKGLYSSTVVEHLEKQYSCSISDHFDMICGTSTGGLIALALALKIPAREISSFYQKYGKVIFPKRNKLWGIIRQTVWKGKYSDKPLRQVLEKMFEQRKIGDVYNLLCIPSYSITDGQPCVFKYDHEEGDLKGHNHLSCIDVALATSAAPTYFPVCEMEDYDGKQMIDGGVWANNPTLVGLIEAISYFVGKNRLFDSIQILSISSLNITNGKPTGSKRERSFLQWRNDLFDTSIVGQSYFTDYVMRKLCELNHIKIHYQRVESERISAEQQHLVQLDIASENSIKLIRLKGNNMGHIVRRDPEIGSFFKNQKLYKVK